VKIEAEDNLQDLFEVKNEGSELVIRMKSHAHYNSKKKMKVYITFKKLTSMELKTVGNVSSDQNMSFDDLKIDNKSVGSVDLKMDIENTGVGSAEVNAEKELKVKDSFLGKVTNKGGATIKRMNKVTI
jgi:Putative auto-transporter adhesin, head GIN domain